mgnify:CR=1 FL=1
MKKLAVLGASGHGKVVADCAEEAGWQQVVFFDDAWPTLSANCHWHVQGDSAALLASLADFDGVVVAIGNNAARHTRIAALRDAGAALVSVLHPAASISRYASIGTGVVVFAGAVVNADVTIGDGAIINTGATVDHDCVIGPASHISPGANLAGGVSVGERAWVGIGAAVKQLVKIGANSTVGAGAVVVRDVPDDAIVVGNPARPLSQ